MPVLIIHIHHGRVRLRRTLTKAITTGVTKSSHGSTESRPTDFEKILV
jgi:hypothetical protein